MVKRLTVKQQLELAKQQFNNEPEEEINILSNNEIDDIKKEESKKTQSLITTLMQQKKQEEEKLQQKQQKKQELENLKNDVKNLQLIIEQMKINKPVNPVVSQLQQKYNVRY